ncbi:hypothetical protein MSAN_00154700 [Mycena sanguinolenta]|uniref:VCBS repeat-containing protein n=1 Tax=Mycena sanguinolenta TaxID=230812 RepID=A0A8H7DL08_9AGAR|nr:hypothetical protein MSAN_00154700 [Mycena sanguinolenta]
MTSKVISQTLPVPAASPGISDIVGFGTQGVVILRNSICIRSVKVINDFGYDAGGYRTEKHVRLIADTTGDKRGDIVGFGERGVWISVNKGNNSFTDPPQMVLADFSYLNGSWRVEKHIRFMADIRNIGRADIVGFGDGGVFISCNNGSGRFSPPALAVADFGYNAGGWRLDRHLRFLADVTGDGFLDIVGFGDDQVVIGRWRIDKHTRFVADLSGYGRADLIGFGDAGVSDTMQVDGVWKNTRDSLPPSRRISVATSSDSGEDAVYIAINNGNGTFQPVRRVIDTFAYNQGWRVEKHPRFVVDLTGDGCADIIGFGDNAVWVSYNDGSGNFGPAMKLIDDFAYSGGWTLEKTVCYVANL